jgi:hypothetical protein
MREYLEQTRALNPDEYRLIALPDRAAVAPV